MSVLYRAIWECEPAVGLDAVIDNFRATVTEWVVDDPEAEPLDDGTHEIGCRTFVFSPRVDGLPGLDGVATDNSDESGAVWRTVARVALQDSKAYYLVENHLETDDVTKRVAVGRPRMVDPLLTGSGKSWLGGSALISGVLDISASEVEVLVEQLRSPTRTLPYIVFSEPPRSVRFDWRKVAEKTAKRANGIAIVVALGHDAVSAFKAALGDIAVWGGGVRTYVPSGVDIGSDYQHRFIPARHMANANPGRIVDRLVFAVAQLSSRRRVPELFARAPGVGNATPDLSQDVEALRQRIDDLEFEITRIQDDLAETEYELARDVGHLSRLEREMRNRGLLDIYYGVKQIVADDSLPDDVDAVSEAFLAAQLYLSDDVSIPDAAARDHDPLDAADCAVAWGKLTWRGLRALAAYVRDKRAGFQGNFWIWSEAGRPGSWPATDKKLTMVESDDVRNRDKFRNARMFPVEPSLDESGRKFMESHLKIAQGGGDLAPRVYFYDDTNGSTGKVHVGFVGPHYLVPNTKS